MRLCAICVTLLLCTISVTAHASWWCAETQINAEKLTGAGGTCYSSQERCEEIAGGLCYNVSNKDLRRLMVQGDELVPDPVGDADADAKEIEKAAKKAAKDGALLSINSCYQDFDSLNSGERDACLKNLLELHRTD